MLTFNCFKDPTENINYQDVCSTINPFSAGIDFRRQILTSKVDPRTERIKNVLYQYL